MAFSPGVLKRTPTHTQARLYVTMVLLEMGMFILIKMESFNVLVKSYIPLPTMLKLSSVVVWPVVEW